MIIKNIFKRMWYELTVFFILVVFLIIYLLIINNTFEITEIIIKNKKLPDSFDGYKIVLISDLHDKYFDKDNRRLITAIRDEKPDIIAMAGDMHGDDHDDTKYINFIKNLSEVAPIYYAEGNHDPSPYKKTDYNKYNKALEAAGAVNLNENVVSLKSKKGESINLIGMSWHLYRPGDITLNSNDFNIVLLHNPFSYDDFGENRPELMLSGHVHGGVIRIPFIGGLFSPGAGTSLANRWKREFFFPKYSKGVYDYKESRLIVSTGLGNTSFLSFRLLRPEIVIITLLK
ncbi:MAG: putative metallophosphoesterase [Clostridia bacterium]|nr:putative metallophosphoesterase [Clostridia bacterium]